MARNPAGFREEPLRDAIESEIRDAIADARRLLRLSADDLNPKSIVTAVHTYVGRVPDGTKIEQDDVVALGCIWGEQICKELKWRWATLIDNEKTRNNV